MWQGGARCRASPWVARRRGRGARHGDRGEAGDGGIVAAATRYMSGSRRSRSPRLAWTETKALRAVVDGDELIAAGLKPRREATQRRLGSAAASGRGRRGTVVVGVLGRRGCGAGRGGEGGGWRRWLEGAERWLHVGRRAAAGGSVFIARALGLRGGSAHPRHPCRGRDTRRGSRVGHGHRGAGARCALSWRRRRRSWEPGGAPRAGEGRGSAGPRWPAGPWRARGPEGRGGRRLGQGEVWAAAGG